MYQGFRLKFILLFSVTLFIGVCTTYAQPTKNLYVTKRIFDPPDIDGFIGEECWQLADMDSITYQFSPYNGKKSSKKSEFRILYDDKAIYVAAILYDNPDSVLSGLGRRDDAFNMNADQFIVEFGPYNDGINSFSFMVSGSGVQSDFKTSLEFRDYSWDAVWKSKVRIIERGWVVEMRIPHSAIHFSKNIFQVWSLNVYRLIKRKEETSTWNYINRELAGTSIQSGEMIGIERIRPPLRLSAIPFAGAYLYRDQGAKQWKDDYKAGLELKYGINQAFTLDIALFPDFGQVPYDDIILNVSPFEFKYPEQRHFFNDFGDMFSRADLFYSRRIGLVPQKFEGIDAMLGPGEIVRDNPDRLDITNAIKLTGRTTNNFGLGIVNAMSKPGYIVLEDTLSQTLRTVENQTFTNYNVFGIDKILENNSVISLVNTNLMRDNGEYISNVTGTEFRFSNKKMIYSVAGVAAMSQVYDSTKNTLSGFKANFYFDKISGKFQFRTGIEIISADYTQNDMGFLSLSNEISGFARFHYNIYKPFWKILSFKSLLEQRYTATFDKREFSDARISAGTDILFVNQYLLSLSGFYRPFGNHDYYEAREPGRPFKKAPSYSSYIRLQTDQRKMFSLSLYHRYWGNSASIEMIDHTFGFNPLLRIQSRFQLSFDLFYNRFVNSIGFVDKINDTIFMGQRDIRSFSNTLTMIYSFTNKAWLNLKVRHYWSENIYNKYYDLKDDGKLGTYEIFPYVADQDFQMMNMDLSFKWEFAPGSQVSLVWKNLFSRRDSFGNDRYFGNFSEMMRLPHYNSLSIRFLYYFDFIYLKRNH